jgi:hypothetical protein
MMPPSADGVRGRLVFKAHRWLYHSTPASRVIKKKKKVSVVVGVLMVSVLSVVMV